jgi:ADP-glucose pyrophosphorylase
MWIDPQNKRLVALKGDLINRVDFGYGLLGHINKGGTFVIRRLRVSANHWRADLIDIHVSGRVILFKTVNKEQHEARSEFRAVPGDLTVEQAEAMLKQRAIIAGHTGLN